jgi:glycerate kinase
MAVLDAHLVPGAALVVEVSGLPAALQGAGLVITGEGRIDGQTAFGKAPGEVAQRAHAAGVPVLFLAGTRAAGWDTLAGLGIRSVATLTDEIDQEPGPDRQNLAQLMQNAESILERLAARTVAEHRW